MLSYKILLGAYGTLWYLSYICSFHFSSQYQMKTCLHYRSFIIYDSQTYKDSHLFRKGVTSCIFLTLIYTEQEHTRTHTFSKGVGKLSDLKKCGTLYVPYEITWAAGTYKNSHLFKNLWKQSYQIRCESLYVPYLYIWKPGTYKSSHLFKNTDFVLKNIQELTPFHTNLA